MDTEIQLANQTGSPVFQFTHSPLLNKIHLVQIEMNMFLKNAMERDFTDTFLEDLDFRVENERNQDIVIHGETGSGKSRIAQSIYYEIWKRAKKKINPKLRFSVDNICFTRTEWLERTENLILGDTLIFDEDDQSRIGLGSFRQLEEQEKIEKTLRQSQFNFLFCSPIIEQHVEHYILKAFDIDFDKQLNRAVLFKRDETGLCLPFAFIILKRHEIEGYEEKKAEYRKAVQGRKLSDRFREYDLVAKELIDKLQIGTLKKRTQKSLIQRYFPRFVEEEIKEIMTSVELADAGVNLDDVIKSLDNNKGIASNKTTLLPAKNKAIPIGG